MQASHHAPIKRAIISTYDKTGIVALAKRLVGCGVGILATGGTARLLNAHQIPLTDVSDVTQFPELLDGRVKTLHPHIHAGILARRGQDEAVLKQHQIIPIDLVIVNLYPFSTVINQDECTLANAIEHIDIGGPTLLRAAAKNYQSVTTVMNPCDYDHICQQIETAGQVDYHTRMTLAQNAFAQIAQYDHGIAQYLQQSLNTTR